MVSVSMQHGTSGAAAHAYGYWGAMLGPVFHRYRDAYRFAKLACDLVEKHGFITYQSKVYFAMASVAFWTQPIARSEEHTSELQSQSNLVCRLLLEKKKKIQNSITHDQKQIIIVNQN